MSGRDEAFDDESYWSYEFDIFSRAAPSVGSRVTYIFISPFEIAIEEMEKLYDKTLLSNRRLVDVDWENRTFKFACYK